MWTLYLQRSVRDCDFASSRDSASIHCCFLVLLIRWRVMTEMTRPSSSCVSEPLGFTTGSVNGSCVVLWDRRGIKWSFFSQSHLIKQNQTNRSWSPLPFLGPFSLTMSQIMANKSENLYFGQVKQKRRHFLINILHLKLVSFSQAMKITWTTISKLSSELHFISASFSVPLPFWNLTSGGCDIFVPLMRENNRACTSAAGQL